jgi:hypothetical protein
LQIAKVLRLMEHSIVRQSRNHHLAIMCGRVIQTSAPIRLAIVEANLRLPSAPRKRGTP